MSLKVELLEQSFKRIRPQSAEFAASFYENLFEANPKLKVLFSRSDMKKQQQKLLSSLVLVVENLRKPELLGQVLKDLGTRHIQYGVLPQYYPLVGAALLMTFEQYLGLEWTPEVKLAWVDAYGAIANLMLEGAGYPPLPLQLETLPTPSVEVPKAPTPQKATIAISKAATDVAPPTPSPKAPTPSVEVNQAPTPQKSGALQVELLESSFAKIRPHAAEFAASFYENLFAANPEVKPLFVDTDMKKQQQKLLSALVLVVENLRKPEVLGQVLKDLGARHISYGAIAESYPIVGAALLATFEQCLGLDWTPEVKLAWVDAYGAIANLMLSGAGYAAPPIPSQKAPTPSVEVNQAPTPQKSDALQVALLESSFAKIKPKAAQFAASFYDNLFEAYPEVKPLFLGTDMKKQQKKLLSSLVLVVESLRKPEVLGQVLKDLGARHIQYGVLPKYYPMVGEALLVTFEQCLGLDWTPEVKLAWVDAYGVIANLMLEGAGHAAPSVPSQTVPTPSVGVDIAPIPEKSPVLQVELLPNKSEQIKTLVQEQIKNLRSVFSEGVTVKQIKEKFTYFQEQFVYWFWELPTWAVTLIVVGIVLFLILITDEMSIHFTGANLSFANLKDSNLAGSNLKNANLFGADLSNTRLSGVDLSAANLSAANLMGANLSGANLTDTNLTGANLIDAIVPDGFKDQ